MWDGMTLNEPARPSVPASRPAPARPTPPRRSAIALALNWKTLSALLAVKQVMAASFAWDYGLRKLDLLGQAFFAYLTSAAVIALLRVLTRRHQLAAYLFLSAALSVLLLGDVLHVGQFGSPMSASMLSYAYQLGTVSSAVTDLIEPRHLLLFVDLPVLLAIVLSRKVPSALLQIISARTAALILVGVAGCTGVATTIEGVNPGLSNGYTGVAWRFGLLDYHLLDIAKVTYDGARRRSIPAATKQRIVDDLLARRKASGKGPLHASASGANVIVVQVESLQSFVMDMRLAGAPVVPRMEALAKESVVARTFFHQTGSGRSSDADLLLNCSLYPAPGGAAYFRHERNQYWCLPGILGAAGYQTAAYQSTWADLWNAGRMHRRMGYAVVDSLETYTRDDMIGIGLSDASFLRQTLERIAHLPEPFFAYVTTLTSHVPYEHGERLPLGTLAGTRLGRYLEAIKYTDSQLGAFIEGLRARGLLDRTVLVVYGDHDAVQWSHELQSVLELPDDEPTRFLTVRSVPLLLRLPYARSAGIIEEPLGQVDLAATIAGAIGAFADDALFLGREPGSATPAAVVFPGGEAIDRTRLYVPPKTPAESGACWLLEEHSDVGADRCADLARRAEQDLETSRLLLEYDLHACGRASRCGASGE